MISNSLYYRNETEVESKLIVQYLLPELGYTPDTWFQEVAFGNIRLDFMAFTMRIIPGIEFIKFPLTLIVEAKSPQKNLNHHISQIQNYMTSLQAPYGVLTNGLDFRIYELNQHKIKLKFHCAGSEIKPNIEEIKSLIGKNKLTYSFNKTQELNPMNTNKMKIIAVYHNKGGVGKTTTVVNLAAAFRKQGKRVLIVDLDSQANTTYAVGLARFLDEKDDNIKGKNILQLLQSRDKYSIQDVTRRSNFVSQGLDVIPAHIEMMEFEETLGKIDAAKSRLISKLRHVQDDYDFVFIDTPPSLNLFARIALLTAGYLIIPSDLKPFANEGLSNVRNFIADINEAKEMFGMDALKVLGVLPSKISTNPRFVQYTYPKRRALVEERYKFPLMNTAVFEREDMAKALENTLEYGGDDIPDPQSVLDYNPDSISAQEFQALAHEVMQKILED